MGMRDGLITFVMDLDTEPVADLTDLADLDTELDTVPVAELVTDLTDLAELDTELDTELEADFTDLIDFVARLLGL